MKKLILVAIVALFLSFGFVNQLRAQGGESCNCGYADDGACLPCGQDCQCGTDDDGECSPCDK